jgi:DNA primase
VNTSPPPRIELDDVRAALTTGAVLEHYGWKAKRSGSEFESSACPARADHSRRAFLINANSGRWQCFPCGTHGDLFDFIAANERLRIPADFTSVIAKAAEIAGVGASTMSDDERRRRREEWQSKQAEIESREREERRARDEAAVPKATAYWESLERVHERGLEYLRARGVDQVIQFPDVVRFDLADEGSPALALRRTTGEIHNVVTRRFPELGEPKTPGLYKCPSLGTFIHTTADIVAGRDVVLVEGVFDSITAVLAWPNNTVLGAHCGGNLPKIAVDVIPAVIKANVRLLIVPHQDKAGMREATAAGAIAINAGLSIRRGTLQIVKHPEKDLNDAWRGGWRPSA